MSKISFPDFWKYYKGTPNQLEAIVLLESQLPISLLSEEAAWVLKYREKEEAPSEADNPLDVKYFWQQDNGPEGWRQCQTSSIAMCLNYLKVPGINDDVDYLKIVQKYGDTTLQSSHAQAMNSLGVKNRFRTDGSKESLIARIEAGFPVPIGILHHGPVSAPSGGGHYIVAHGVFDDYCLCSDPYGELNLTTGQWAATGQQDGNRVQYSWKNLMPRWDLNNGTKDGWYWEIG